MATIVIRHAAVLVTMDRTRSEIPDGGMVIRDGVIEAVGPTNELPTVLDARMIEMDGHIILPGLVNTHHHLYQTLTRAVPAAQNATLFTWLKTLYPIWARMTPEAVYISALTGMAELLLSGCTTVSDHLYLFPNGSKLEDEIRAAQEIGIRLHASRGSMSLGESKGGLPPDSVVEAEDAILKDTQRLIQAFHDPKPGAMVRVAVAPCSPFSVTSDLMRESAKLARQYKVMMHTHLAETLDEEQFCLQKFGHRPVDYMQTLDWVGPDVWYAHAVHVNDVEIGLMARTGCGAAHCPTSNMRLGSGIAPVKKYRAAGVKVGLGVDGSASNDGSHLLGEARQAMLLARVMGDPAGLTARDLQRARFRCLEEVESVRYSLQDLHYADHHLGWLTGSGRRMAGQLAEAIEQVERSIAPHRKAVLSSKFGPSLRRHGEELRKARQIYGPIRLSKA